MKPILICVAVAVVGLTVTAFLYGLAAIGEGYGEKGDGVPFMVLASVTLIATGIAVWRLRPKKALLKRLWRRDY